LNFSYIGERFVLGQGSYLVRARPSSGCSRTFGVRPGIDLDRINQLVDELDAEDAGRKLVQSRKPTAESPEPKTS
jgi:hypothetical protein